MSSTKSNLTNSKYCYDFVVATTQAGINTAMKEYLNELLQPVVKICYVADDNGNPTPIDYDDLIALANGSDPFTVPNDADPMTNQDLQNLLNARFLTGFQAQIGLPEGMAPEDIPDVVILGSNTASVTYNLLCAEFIAVQLTPESGYSPAAWMNESQPVGGPPWVFTSQVDLRLTDDSAYADLPPDVQEQVDNLNSNAFNIQQLLFDLDNAALETVPTISGIDPGSNLYMVLQKDFIGVYFTSLQENGEPVLGYTITNDPPKDESTLLLTDLNMNVNPFMDEDGQPISDPTSEEANLTTLNYLCAANGNSLPAASQFTWNWIDSSEKSDYQGAVSINANTYANWLNELISPSLEGICRNVKCSCDVDTWGTITYSLKFKDPDDGLSYDIIDSPTVNGDTGFAKILNFSYTNDCSSNGGTEGWIWGNIKSTYSVTSKVYVGGSQMKVVTQVVVYIHINCEGGVTEGNFADYTTTDIFDLSITSDGKLVSDYSSSTKDNSDDINTSTWSQIASLGSIDDVIDDEIDFVQGAVTSYLSDFNNDISKTINSPQAWVFPGGATFIFKNVAFSDFQDLVSHITYAQS